jgi:hypothetical protein
VSQTAEYIRRLEALQGGERLRLRSLAGQPLHSRLDGFDLFTGLWWPLRQRSPVTPRRETSWLIAKLYGTFADAVPHVLPEGSKQGPTLPAVLGSCEPPRPHCRDAALLTSPPPDRDPAKSEFIAARRFRRRFDALLCSPLPALEPHLRWALGEVARANGARGIDWAILLDDLLLWDRGYNPADTHQKHRLSLHAQVVGCGEEHGSPQDLWACAYLRAARHTPQGA